MERLFRTGTTRQSTKCRGTNRGTEADSCGTETGTTRMATRGRPCGSRRHRRRPRGFVNVFWTQKTRHADRSPGFFGWRTRRASWRSFKSTRGPGKGRRRNRRRILLNNLNRRNLRLMNSTFHPFISTPRNFHLDCLDREKKRKEKNSRQNVFLVFLDVDFYFVTFTRDRSCLTDNELKNEMRMRIKKGLNTKNRQFYI